MADNKKMVAAVAAVMDYIKTEQEVAMAASAGAQAAPSLQPPAPDVNVWGLSGRESMMHLRNLMQLKAFHGSRFR